MNKLTVKWLEYASADLEAAEVLVRSGRTNYSFQLAVLHCHQAIEKILKTLIVNRNEAPKRTHDLIKLAVDVKIKMPSRFNKYIGELNAHYQPARYPDISYHQPVLRYDLDKAKYHLDMTEGLFRWLEKKISRK